MAPGEGLRKAQLRLGVFRRNRLAVAFCHDGAPTLILTVHSCACACAGRGLLLEKQTLVSFGGVTLREGQIHDVRSDSGIDRSAAGSSCVWTRASGAERLVLGAQLHGV